ncbi:hypothetical protein NDU88_005405 [Pleurodeles waltl]|uniref:Uncharacterized protein n=1 Tax=Pleurodeles waltl TaxID=8319 RepID=A0AAV7VJS1_PLEWA|nr:hypothetical protein NDU88_005405 [Pleurodeles waltl]
MPRKPPCSKTHAKKVLIGVEAKGSPEGGEDCLQKRVYVLYTGVGAKEEEGGGQEERGSRKGQGQKGRKATNKVEAPA